MALKNLAVLGVMAVVAMAQSTPTARQLFYSPAKPAAAKAKPPVASAVPKPTKTKKAAPERAAVNAVAEPPAAAAATSVAYRPGTGGDDPVIAISTQPLALRYSLVQIAESEDDDAEVSTSKVFHAGDRVRIRVQSNQDGYLYVVQRGSSGNWEPLFPSLAINDGKNRIEARASLDLPSQTQAFTFNAQAGDERLFVILSRTPVNDVERLVYRLRGEDGKKQPDPSAPSLMAQNVMVGNDLVEQLRRTNSRDLVIETVGTRTGSGSRKKSNLSAEPENAVYVATASGSTVVADIQLIHQ